MEALASPAPPVAPSLVLHSAAQHRNSPDKHCTLRTPHHAMLAACYCLHLCLRLQAQQAAESRAQLTVLAQQSEARHRDGYSLNKQLRAALRQSKKTDAQVDAK